MTGAQLKTLRKEVLELSQEEFAERLKVARSTIIRAEQRGSRRISHVLELILERAVLKGDLRIPGDK
jgi:transcriptional regulator with XRE-family HTH domain